MTEPAASLALDPFDDAFLTDPYPFHEEIREAGAGRVSRRLRHLRLGPPRRGDEGPVGMGDLLLRRRRRPRRFPPLETVAAAEPDPGGRSAAAHPQPHRAQPRAVGQGDGGIARALPGRRRDARRRARRRATRSTPSPRSPRPIRYRCFPAPSASAPRAGKPAALRRDGVQRLRPAQQAFRGLDARRRRASSAGSTRNAQREALAPDGHRRRRLGRPSTAARSPPTRRRCWCARC